MRKIILELYPDKLKQPFRSILPKSFFESFEYMETRTILRIDMLQGQKIVICDIRMKNGYTIKDLTMPTNYQVYVLRKKGNDYTCLLNIKMNQKIMKIIKTLKLDSFLEDISADIPANITEKRVVISFIGEEEGIKKTLKIFNKIGEFKVVSVQNNITIKENLISSLTPRQKEVILLAKKTGYYEIPRRVSSEDLAEKLGISKATTIEHLRKAENKILSILLAGY